MTYKKKKKKKTAKKQNKTSIRHYRIRTWLIGVYGGFQFDGKFPLELNLKKNMHIYFSPIYRIQVNYKQNSEVVQHLVAPASFSAFSGACKFFPTVTR